MPEISSEAEGAVWLFVQGDVIRAFELDDVIAFGFVFVIAPGFSVLEQGQPQLLTRRAQGFDVFDLCFDFGEVRHVFLSVDWWLASFGKNFSSDVSALVGMLPGVDRPGNSKNH